jgi:Spy/CpxP family protein refolding chaperone
MEWPIAPTGCAMLSAIAKDIVHVGTSDLPENTMNSTAIKSITLLSAPILLACVIAGFDMAQADPQGGGYGMYGEGQGMHGEYGGGMHGDGMYGSGHHGGMHGGGNHSGCKRGGSPLYGDDWRATLTDEQMSQLDRLHVAYAKTKAPRKARMQALKVELTVLATAAAPDKEAINAKVDELLEIKRQALRARYAYIAAQQQVLTPDQQVSFDMQMIRKAMHGKRARGGHH